MSRFDDFFDEDPPSGHAAQVMQAAASELESNRIRQAREKKKKAIWGILGLGFATAAGLALWNRQSQMEQEQAFGLMGFEDIEVDDVEILAMGEESLDAGEDWIEFLDSLDEIDELGEES